MKVKGVFHNKKACLAVLVAEGKAEEFTLYLPLVEVVNACKRGGVSEWEYVQALKEVK